MSRIVYVNGSYVPENEGKVSIFDRGFLFADGVYEVTAVIGRKLVDYDPHMERLDRSLNELAMAWPCSKAELRQMHEELIKRNKLDEGMHLHAGDARRRRPRLQVSQGCKIDRSSPSPRCKSFANIPMRRLASRSSPFPISAGQGATSSQ